MKNKNTHGSLYVTKVNIRKAVTSYKHLITFEFTRIAVIPLKQKTLAYIVKSSQQDNHLSEKHFGNFICVSLINQSNANFKN